MSYSPSVFQELIHLFLVLGRHHLEFRDDVVVQNVEGEQQVVDLQANQGRQWGRVSTSLTRQSLLLLGDRDQEVDHQHVFFFFFVVMKR